MKKALASHEKALGEFDLDPKFNVSITFIIIQIYKSPCKNRGRFNDCLL